MQSGAGSSFAAPVHNADTRAIYLSVRCTPARGRRWCRRIRSEPGLWFSTHSLGLACRPVTGNFTH